MEFIYTMTGTGFNICPNISEVLSIFNTQKLSGNLIFAFHEAEGTFAEVVGSRHSEITNPFRVVVLIFFKSDQQRMLVIAVVRIGVLETFPVTGFQEASVLGHEPADLLVRKMHYISRNQLLSFMDRPLNQFFQLHQPSVMADVNQFLQIPFQMLKAFNIPE